jgi:predicted RNA-binding Zn ribbon-like protein
MSSRRFSVVGGHPALNFANSVSWRLDDERRMDYLTDFGEAIRCLVELEVIASAEGEAVQRLGAGSPVAAMTEVARLRELREAIYAAVIDDLTAAPVLSAQFAEFAAAATLAPGASGMHWELPVDLALPRLRMAKMAVDLFTGTPPGRLRRCDDDACGWVFLDHSPRRNRRWCDSADCGNRNRLRAHYERERQRSRS